MALRTDEIAVASGAAAHAHPLDPLSASEMTAASVLVREHFKLGDKLMFESLDLVEPSKEVVRNFVPGTPIERIARFNVYERGSTGVWKGHVDIGAGSVFAVEFLADVRPMISPEEFMAIEEAAKNDPRVLAALKRRGIDTTEYVCVDPWSAGNFAVPGEEGRRLAHTFVWVRMFDVDNYYAHPVEGLNVVVDVDLLEVIRVDDYGAETGEFTPIPETPINYDSSIVT
jgi:primary-amine oxidase